MNVKSVSKTQDGKIVILSLPPFHSRQFPFPWWGKKNCIGCSFDSTRTHGGKSFERKHTCNRSIEQSRTFSAQSFGGSLLFETWRSSITYQRHGSISRMNKSTAIRQPDKLQAGSNVAEDDAHYRGLKLMHITGWRLAISFRLSIRQIP